MSALNSGIQMLRRYQDSLLNDSGELYEEERRRRKLSGVVSPPPMAAPQISGPVLQPHVPVQNKPMVGPKLDTMPAAPNLDQFPIQGSPSTVHNPNWDIMKTDTGSAPAPVLAFDPGEAARELRLMRYGFMPLRKRR